MKSMVAAIQMISGADVEANLEVAARLIHEAADAGADLVVLPENFAVLDGNALVDYAEAQGDENALLQGFLSWQSKKHRLFLVGGTVPLNTRPKESATEDGKSGQVSSGGAESPVAAGLVRPACLVFDPDGDCAARYDKLHLFNVQVDDEQATYSESLSFEPGEEVVALSTPLGRVGLTICYDLRFPELYRRLQQQQVDLITVPSAFTHVTGQAHWEPLLRARAIENQCYIIAANQGGVHNPQRETFGHSMIIDPWGKVLASMEKGEGVVMAGIDLDYLQSVRRKMPALEHRRF